MESAQITRFGGPDVLHVNDIERPAPGPGEVLVRVGASSVNGHDVLVRSGQVRMVSGRRFPIAAGLDFAGEVTETGSGVESYRAGDQVWGMVHPRQRHTTAGAAEYVVVPAGRIAPTPAGAAGAAVAPAGRIAPPRGGLSPVDAASLVVGGATALIALRDSVRLV